MLKKVNTFLKLLIKDRELLKITFADYFARTKVSHIFSDKFYLSLQYKIMMKKKINWEAPQMFSEKIQWLKINDRKKQYINVVDKYEVKKYIKQSLGEEYVIPTIGIWDKFEDIDLSMLPNEFVMKCTHDSQSVIICKNKEQFNFKLAKKKIDKCLKKNLFWYGREWPYKFVKPRIIVEKYMKDSSKKELIDYKFFCFNGKPKYCQVICDRSTNETIDFFDMDWEHQEFIGISSFPNEFKNNKNIIKKPFNFEKMKEFAYTLAKDTRFVRIDFYEIDERLYFGEITFYPASGFGRFEPEIWDKKLGNMINLNDDQRCCYEK